MDKACRGLTANRQTRPEQERSDGGFDVNTEIVEGFSVIAEVTYNSELLSQVASDTEPDAVGALAIAKAAYVQKRIPAKYFRRGVGVLSTRWNGCHQENQTYKH